MSVQASNYQSRDYLHQPHDQFQLQKEEKRNRVFCSSCFTYHERNSTSILAQRVFATFEKDNCKGFLKRFTVGLKTLHQNIAPVPLSKQEHRYSDSESLNLIYFNSAVDESLLKLTRFIGEGTYGTVYEGCYRKNVNSEMKQVAVKINKPDTYGLEQIKTEIKFLNFISQHDPLNLNSIVPFLFSGNIDNDTYYLVLPFYEQNLYDFILSDKKISFDSLSEMSNDLIDALLFLQKHSIAHLDLKPENILLSSSENIQLRIADFGSAEKTPSQNEKSLLATTLFYRSPEILLGTPFSSKADWWSFACVLFEILTKKPLFTPSDAKELLKMIYELIDAAPEEFIIQAQQHHEFFVRETFPPYKYHYVNMNEFHQEHRRSHFERQLVAASHQNGGRLVSKNVKDCWLFKDFLFCLLRWNPSDRVELIALKKHPFILLT